MLADAAGKRLFIADSTHHRIVITDLDGKKIAVAGTGTAGKEDGAFAKASFNDPQGMALKGDTLYVADRKNHMIRALDLKAKTVKTVAGTGEQDRDRRKGGAGPEDRPEQPVGPAPGRQPPVHRHGRPSSDLDARPGQEARSTPLCRQRPRRTSPTATLADARFAQPSGLASDGKTLYVADSEVSAIRALPLDGKGDGRDHRRRGPVRVRRRGRRRRARSACSTPSASPITTASSTWPTPTTARSR